MTFPDDHPIHKPRRWSRERHIAVHQRWLRRLAKREPVIRQLLAELNIDV